VRLTPPPSRITRRLWVGGALDVADVALLHAGGVTHVLNVSRVPDDRTVLASLRSAWAPTDDDMEFKDPTWFRRGVLVARAVWTDPANALYVHCTEGIHRGPLMAYAILRALDGRSAAQAIGAIQRARPSANFPDVYLRSAESFLATAAIVADGLPHGPDRPSES